jgi:hypothetical protein
MNINIINLYPKVILGLGLVCGMLGVVTSDTASSQTTPSPTNDLEVTAYSGTYFKRQIDWYQQSPEISDINQRCYARQGERFLVSSYRRPVNESPVREDNRNSRYFGNIEYPGDYWEVTFQNLPSRCSSQLNQGGQTWFVYRRHVSIR